MKARLARTSAWNSGSRSTAAQSGDSVDMRAKSTLEGDGDRAFPDWKSGRRSLVGCLEEPRGQGVLRVAVHQGVRLADVAKVAMRGFRDEVRGRIAAHQRHRDTRRQGVPESFEPDRI